MCGACIETKKTTLWRSNDIADLSSQIAFDIINVVH
jgi:hypothetical protein